VQLVWFLVLHFFGLIQQMVLIHTAEISDLWGFIFATLNMPVFTARSMCTESLLKNKKQTANGHQIFKETIYIN
jgi:hypothetical protein